VKRLIFGVGDDGRNVTLHQGPLRRLGIHDEELAAESKAANESIYVAWAARDSKSGTDDYASEIADFNLKLKPGETRFIRVSIGPGAQSAMHRTPNVNDYLIAMSGELTMYLEDGSSAKIEAGDMFVQLAGWHWWKNEGTEPFVMAGIVVGIETDVDVPYGVEMVGKDH
jgi:quercetin dioxygenase-like cupin family protein